MKDLTTDIGKKYEDEAVNFLKKLNYKMNYIFDIIKIKIYIIIFHCF